MNLYEKLDYVKKIKPSFLDLDGNGKTLELISQDLSDSRINPDILVYHEKFLDGCIAKYNKSLKMGLVEACVHAGVSALLFYAGSFSDNIGLTGFGTIYSLSSFLEFCKVYDTYKTLNLH